MIAICPKCPTEIFCQIAGCQKNPANQPEQPVSAFRPSVPKSVAAPALTIPTPAEEKPMSESQDIRQIVGQAIAETSVPPASPSPAPTAPTAAPATNAFGFKKGPMTLVPVSNGVVAVQDNVPLAVARTAMDIAQVATAWQLAQ